MWYHGQNSTYAAIIQRYGPLLNETEVERFPFGTPPRPIRSEGAFQAYFCEFVRIRVRRALRVGFEHLSPLSERQLVKVTLEYGTQGRIDDNFKPNTAFVLDNPEDPNPVNRAPGDIRVSWKWNSSYGHSRDPLLRREYYKVMAQVDFDMCQHGARHAYVMTDTEFVAIKRLDENGQLAVAEAIPWTSGGVGQPSVLLGLWYLGMLAVEEDTWSL